MQQGRRLLSEGKVRERFGGVSSTTLRRWDDDPTLNFPKAIKIRGRKFRDADALDAFEEAQRAKSRERGSA